MLIKETNGRETAASKTRTPASPGRFRRRFFRLVIVIGVGAFLYGQYQKGAPLVPGIKATQLSQPQTEGGGDVGVAASLINRALGRHSTNQANQTATKKQTIPLEEMPRLEGILFTKSNPIAIINGARLSQGETFQYALSRGTIPITLAEIHPNSVLIHTPDLTPITLRIGGTGDRP